MTFDCSVTDKINLFLYNFSRRHYMFHTGIVWFIYHSLSPFLFLQKHCKTAHYIFNIIQCNKDLVSHPTPTAPVGVPILIFVYVWIRPQSREICVYGCRKQSWQHSRENVEDRVLLIKSQRKWNLLRMKLRHQVRMNQRRRMKSQFQHRCRRWDFGLIFSHWSC